MKTLQRTVCLQRLMMMTQRETTGGATALRKDTNKSIDIRELLQRVRQKTNQTTYRNRQNRVQVIPSHHPSQYYGDIEPKGKSMPVQGEPAAVSISLPNVEGQSTYRSPDDTHHQKAGSRKRDRSPKVVRTYGKKRRLVIHCLPNEETMHITPLQGASPGTQEPGKRENLDRSENGDAKFVSSKRKNGKKRTKPRRVPTEGFTLTRGNEGAPSAQAAIDVCRNPTDESPDLLIIESRSKLVVIVEQSQSRPKLLNNAKSLQRQRRSSNASHSVNCART